MHKHTFISGLLILFVIFQFQSQRNIFSCNVCGDNRKNYSHSVVTAFFLIFIGQFKISVWRTGIINSANKTTPLSSTKPKLNPLATHKPLKLWPQQNTSSCRSTRNKLLDFMPIIMIANCMEAVSLISYITHSATSLEREKVNRKHNKKLLVFILLRLVLWGLAIQTLLP